MKDQLEEAYAVPESAVDVMGGVFEVLEYYGLAAAQIRVYLYLLKSGPQKNTDIAVKVGAHRTEAYRILNELGAMGLVSKTLSRPSLYTAPSFREATGLLWRERRRTVDAMQLMGDALGAAFEGLPLGSEEKKVTPFTFTCHQINGLLRSKVERLGARCRRRLYYLEEPARRNLDQVIDRPVMNVGHPELGSFLVFDNAVFIVRQDHRGKWGALEFRMPEMVEAYALLYEFLMEAESLWRVGTLFFLAVALLWGSAYAYMFAFQIISWEDVVRKPWLAAAFWLIFFYLAWGILLVARKVEAEA